MQDLGRPEAAVEAYQRAIALRPGDADAHSNLGSLQRTLGRHAQALASFDQAIALRPDHAGAHHSRANLLAQLGPARRSDRRP
ncbi:MAG: tetratricopeptide repeat protein [Ideonella sp.]|nr:tetratricopeptide repeat protein [Ideonella sp.]